MNNILQGYTHFRFVDHPNDLMRDTSVQMLPHPYNNQEDFWLWFHPCYQHSQDIADLDDLYKQLHDEEFDLRIIASEVIILKKQIQKEIGLLEEKISSDCFKNFYQLIFNAEIELIEQ